MHSKVNNLSGPSFFDSILSLFHKISAFIGMTDYGCRPEFDSGAGVGGALQAPDPGSKSRNTASVLESTISSEGSSIESPLESTISSEASSAEVSLESTISSEASSVEESLESKVPSEASINVLNPHNLSIRDFAKMRSASKKAFFIEIAKEIKCNDAHDEAELLSQFKASPFGIDGMGDRFEKVLNSTICPEISSEIPSEQSELPGVVPSDPPHDEF